MSKQERVVCAAVIFYRDEHDDAGITIMGLTHERCGEIYNSLSYDGYVECHEGYITNLNNYVTPYQALDIMAWGDQPRFKDRRYLLPGDLY